MIILISQNVSSKVRGYLKRWFIEPKANVFVSTIKKRNFDEIKKFILSQKLAFNFLVIYTTKNQQGFAIENYGSSKKELLKISGNFLVGDKNDIPF